MNDWDEGYVSDHVYGNYYFGQLAPEYLKGILRLSGYKPPEQSPLRYLELGFGQGLSLNIHAAIDQDTEFWGTDFLPEQALNAQNLARDAQLGTHILNYSFAELETLVDQNKLPSFDMIVLHGIWSWVNAENRQHILNIIQKTLKPKGFVYVSYNALPGQTLWDPMRKLMMLYIECKGQEKDSLTLAKESIDFIHKLAQAEATFFTENNLTKKVATIREKDPSYIAHEYLNQDWDHFYFMEVVKAFHNIGCTYAVSARHLEAFSFAQPPDTLPLINEIMNPYSQEALRDFNLYQGFRADLYTKDNSPLSKVDYQAQINACYFALTMPISQISFPLTLTLTHFQGTLESDLYNPILQALAQDDYAPKTINAIQSLTNSSFDQLLFCINLLVGMHYVTFANPTPKETSVLACQRMNRITCQQTQNGIYQPNIASPVLGQAIPIAEYTQLLFLAYTQGIHDTENLIEHLKQMMRSLNKVFCLQVDGSTVEGNAAFSLVVNLFQNDLPFYITMKCLI